MTQIHEENSAMADQNIQTNSPANGDDEQASTKMQIEVIENLSKDFLPLACDHARKSGWPEELIIPFATCALELFVNDIFDGSDPDAAYDDAMTGAVFTMGVEIYTTVLEEGGTPGDAFLHLLFFHDKVDQFRGEQGVTYPHEWIDAAVAAVTQSAEKGADPVDQIEAGYDALSSAALAT